MKTGIRTVIWDMGGVILRTEDWKPRIKLGQDYGFSLDGIHDFVFKSESAVEATLGKINEEDHRNAVGESLKISDPLTKEFCQRFFEGDRLDEDLVSFIRDLKPVYTTALLSNAWSGARKSLTVDKPCIDAFHVSVFSCEVGLAKPDPMIYRYLLRLCGVEPQEAIFVDDARENIEAANELGIHGVLFVNAEQAKSDVNFLLNHGM
jgi:putative hydrolase of the HAD superfamily